MDADLSTALLAAWSLPPLTGWFQLVHLDIVAFVRSRARRRPDSS